jgi:cell wall-associated NlpC family hydrolase
VAFTNRPVRESGFHEAGIEPARIVAAARSMLGAPYHHQGRDRALGLDCVGLLIEVAKEIGAAYHDLSGYSGDGRITADGRGHSLLRSELGTSLVEVIDVRQARDGDVLCFWIHRELVPHHVGIKAGDGMIHAAALVNGRKGCVIERRRLGAWALHLDSVWRFQRNG